MNRLLSVALFACVIFASAKAQTFEISVLAGLPRVSDAPLGSISEQDAKDDDTRLKGKNGYGVRLTWNTPGYYGHEIGYLYSFATLQTIVRTGEKPVIVTPVEDRVRLRQVSYNFLIYFMPKGERFRPFMTGGLEMLQYGAPGIPEWPTGSSRNYGANYGGGLKIKLFEHALIRLDVRDHLGGKPYDLTFEDPTRSGGILRQFEASAGLSVTF